MKWLIPLVLLVGCMQPGSVDTDIAVEALRIQLADAERSAHTYQTELEILEEKVNRQHAEIEKGMQQRVAAMESRLNELERKQQATITDLRKIARTNEQAKARVAQVEKELAKQVLDLKKAMESVVKLAQHSTTLTVQSGDTLERIARREGTSITALKKANGLKNDTIYVGQQLKLP